MYPGTKFNWYDQSQFSTIKAKEELENPPLILTAFSADKGTEEMIRIKGAKTFEKMYGTNLSFEKHGQALIQAKRVIDSGGELLCKRVVAKDATLSNMILSCNLYHSVTQNVDEDKNKLYIDNITGEVVRASMSGGVVNKPLTTTSTKIKWVKNVVENCKTFDEVMEVATKEFEKATKEKEPEVPMEVYTIAGKTINDIDWLTKTNGSTVPIVPEHDKQYIVKTVGDPYENKIVVLAKTKYKKIDEDIEDAYIVKTANTMAVDWLSATDNGNPITPVEGKVYLVRTPGAFFYKFYKLGKKLFKLVEEDEKKEVYINTGATELDADWFTEIDGGTALTPVDGVLYKVKTPGTYEDKVYRFDGVTNKYVEEVDTTTPAYIVDGATPLNEDWLSLTNGGTPLTPIHGTIYRIKSNGIYKDNAYTLADLKYVEEEDTSTKVYIVGDYPLASNWFSLTPNGHSFVPVANNRYRVVSMDEYAGKLYMLEEPHYEEYKEDDGTTIGEKLEISIPMYVVTDIGRNNNYKNLRIVPDYATSKSLGCMIYTIAEVEDGVVNESQLMTANPYVNISNINYAIQKYMMKYIYIEQIHEAVDLLVKKMSEMTKIAEEELYNLDFIFGCNLKGAPLDGVVIDIDSIDLSTSIGIALEGGSRGKGFGEKDHFYLSDEYEDAMVSFFSGEVTDEIYDVDVHKIVACIDANYTYKIKEAITQLAIFREDFFFFRDLGLGLNTFKSIITEDKRYTRTRFAANYMTSYKIIDPYTNKRISVTCMYDMAKVLVDHLANNPQIPYAGEANSFILESAIAGTVNYIPVNTPNVNQKDLLDEAKVNYATYYQYGGDLIIESLYTSQEGLSQLSYLNNVIAIQEVMRALRTGCPKIRFKFQNGNDFSEYEEKCKRILENYRNWFTVLEFVYTQDDLRATQKIFYASINFAFNNWVQSEIFDLYAIPVINTKTE